MFKEQMWELVFSLEFAVVELDCFVLRLLEAQLEDMLRMYTKRYVRQEITYVYHAKGHFHASE